MHIIWSEEIDEILGFYGVSLECVGVKNWALERDNALQAIYKLEILGIPILGGDVYRMVDNMPQLTYDNWFCDKYDHELAPAFLERSLELARKYICSYLTDDALFAIVPRI